MLGWKDGKTLWSILYVPFLIHLNCSNATFSFRVKATIKLLCGFSLFLTPSAPSLPYTFHSHADSFFHFSISRHFRDWNVYEVFLAYKAITLYYLPYSTSLQIRVRVFVLIFSHFFSTFSRALPFSLHLSLVVYSLLKSVLKG